MYLLNLYFRNVKGTFFKGFMPVGNGTDYTAPFAWLIHLAMLPITLTLGAGIKTLIDFFTRKYVPAEDIAAKSKEIELMNADQMTLLTTQLSKYDPMSNSSRVLLLKLSQLDINEKNLVNQGSTQKEKMLLTTQRTQLENFHAPYAINPKILKELKLDEQKSAELAEYNKSNKDNLHKQKLVKQKQVIQDYLGSEKNNGKKLLQIIVGLFSVKEPAKKHNLCFNSVNLTEQDALDTTLTTLPL